MKNLQCSSAKTQSHAMGILLGSWSVTAVQGKGCFWKASPPTVPHDLLASITLSSSPNHPSNPMPPWGLEEASAP